MADILVTSPFQPFTLPTQFKAVFNGYIYCGTVDAVDPSVSQVQVYLINEAGDKVPVAQPLRTNAGGYLVYNGQPAKFVTDSNHSLLVQDSFHVQLWYEPDMATIDPEAAILIIGSQAIEALRRSYAEAGYTLVTGSFETGGTVSASSDVLLFDAEGKAYSWGGTLPKTVPAGSTPSNSGGIGPSAWIDRSSSLLRSDLGSNAGAGLVGSGTGETVEARLVREESSIGNVKSATTPNSRIKSILLSAHRGGVREEELKALYGYTELFPQGIAQDPQTEEWFVCYAVLGGTGDINAGWIDVYDSDFVYSGKTFGIRCRFPEGLLIGYVSGQRRVGHSSIPGDEFVRVTPVPATGSIVDLQIIEPTITTGITTIGSMSSFGPLAAISSALANNNGGTVHGMVRFFDLQAVLTNTGVASIGTTYLPNGIIGSGKDPAAPPSVLKPQGIALGPDNLAVHSGYWWQPVDGVGKKGQHNTISQFSLSGLLKSSISIRPDVLADKFSSVGIPADALEPEGCAYDVSGRLVSGVVVGTKFVLCAEGESVAGKTTITVPYANLGLCPAGILSNINMTRGISEVTNIAITTADLAADHCIMAGVGTLTFQLKSDATFAVSGKTFTEGKVTIENIDGNVFFIRVAANTGSYEFRGSGAVVGTVRTWTMQAQMTGGSNITNPAPLNSLIQRAAQNFGQDRYIVAGANAHNPMSFSNVTNGQIGSIAMSATSTAFNTTSDERLKNKHGPMVDAVAVVQQIADSGAVQLAAFKSLPDDVRPMALAQRLYAIYPWAVTPGHGEPDDEDFVPWQVDYSQLVPLLILALAEKYQ